MHSKILVLGAGGQIGTELTLALRKLHGIHAVIASDIKASNEEFVNSGPFEIIDAWPDGLKESVAEFQKTSEAKKKALDAIIVSSLDGQELKDRPIIAKGVIRVSGPFSVESVRPEELSLDENGELIDPTPNEFEINDGQGTYAQNASAYEDAARERSAQRP